MLMTCVRLCVGAMAMLLWALPAAAQNNPPSPASDTTEAGGSDCGTRAALYTAEKGFKLWVTRRGAMTQENPLRPLSPEPKLVLEVAVNGRIATAHGADFAHLQRSGPPSQLEETSVGPIRWEPKMEGMPATMKVVADDGRVVLGPLRFVECAEAPKIAAAAAKRPARKAAPQGGPAPSSQAPSGLALPQGAIPE
jgi:hypothetical protein